MDQFSLHSALGGLELGPVRFFPVTGSTNDEAARWAEEDAPDLALVVADEQTAGRGRLQRRWLTPPGTALAFSLVLRPGTREGIVPSYLVPHIQRSTALGALAVHAALQQEYGLQAEIKWPNDVLVGGRKLCGVLAEAHWQGERLAALILGIGINIAPASVPPDEGQNFPTTCVESALGRPVERLALLRSVLAQLLAWRPRLGEAAFIRAWEERLAFRGEQVRLLRDGQVPLEGTLAGLAADGSLLLLTAAGDQLTLQAGEVHLRPVDSG